MPALNCCSRRTDSVFQIVIIQWKYRLCKDSSKIFHVKFEHNAYHKQFIDFRKKSILVNFKILPQNLAINLCAQISKLLNVISNDLVKCKLMKDVEFLKSWTATPFHPITSTSVRHHFGQLFNNAS